jgi:hypothetical protein
MLLARGAGKAQGRTAEGIEAEGAGRTFMVSPPLYFDNWENPPDFAKALDQVRRLSTREGWCFFHV